MRNMYFCIKIWVYFFIAMYKSFVHKYLISISYIDVLARIMEILNFSLSTTHTLIHVSVLLRSLSRETWTHVLSALQQYCCYYRGSRPPQDGRKATHTMTARETHSMVLTSQNFQEQLPCVDCCKASTRASHTYFSEATCPQHTYQPGELHASVAQYL